MKRILKRASRLRKVSCDVDLRADLQCRFAWSCDLEESTIDSMVSLTRKHMRQLYNDAGGVWRWKDETKRSELVDDDARYFLIESECDGMSDLVAFVHFRFTVDDDEVEPVCYVYELQVDEKFRKLGLGSKLMSLVEDLCLSRTEFRKLMLTVFSANDQARCFYEKLGFSPDPTSPLNSVYLILSKSIDGV